MLILIVLLGHDAFYDFWQIKGGRESVSKKCLDACINVDKG